ncbi:hypothetical protein [Aestuariispira insulae]|uniref:Uncharacterized protein n=1 Tax=Aestuariispira insulae TaxID=1461337 RepID=A0A3D9HNY7_9PROT|nr:hypothetical protein [Aestuariispira insulae]RED51208.1 hypothetical protein DFP90_1035 [Aestuariispira insulae]
MAALRFHPDGSATGGEIILALALTALYQGVATGFQGIERSERHRKATLIAQSKLDAIGALYPLENYHRVEELPGGYEVEIAVTPEPAVRRSLFILFKATVTVRWDQGALQLDGLKMATKP